MSLPQFEKIVTDRLSSFKVQELDQDTICRNTTWHFHPEYELTYISAGVGRRQAGHHLSTFTDGELIFLGSRVPHFPFSMGRPQIYQEITLQISPEFMHSGFFEFPELLPVKRLIELAKFGISFGKGTKNKVGDLLNKLTNTDGFTRLSLVLEILNNLAISGDCKVLDTRVPHFAGKSQELEKIEFLFRYIEQNYQSSIELGEVAKQLALSEPYTCRFIKQVTSKSLTQIVNDFRIAKACELLINTQRPISEICYTVGFNNLSNFNKQFRALTNNSPRSYRKNFRGID